MQSRFLNIRFGLRQNGTLKQPFFPKLSNFSINLQYWKHSTVIGGRPSQSSQQSNENIEQVATITSTNKSYQMYKKQFYHAKPNNGSRFSQYGLES